MGLLSFLKRKSGDAAKAPVIPESADSVQQARTRARQRLVGSVVLVAAGVIGFPLLFETQPRPLPGNTPIEIVRKEGSAPATPRVAPPARTPALTPAPSVMPEPAAEAASAAPPPEPQPAAAAEPKPQPEPKPDLKSEPKPDAKPAPKPTDASRAQALLDGKPQPSVKAAGDGRYVVQVGAFAEAAAAREARQKVEKLGLKTYTQMVDTSSGKRIRVRVGPFASRQEADKASAKIKSAGLNSAVYTL